MAGGTHAVDSDAQVYKGANGEAISRRPFSLGDAPPANAASLITARHPGSGNPGSPVSVWQNGKKNPDSPDRPQPAAVGKPEGASRLGKSDIFNPATPTHLKPDGSGNSDGAIRPRKSETFGHTRIAISQQNKGVFPKRRILPVFARPLKFIVRPVVLSTLLAAFAGGCTWTDKGGTHYLVLGLGIGVMTSTNAPGVQVSESRILGAEISPHLSGVGLLQSHRVEIDPSLTNNVVVSVNSHNGFLTVSNFNPYETYTNVFIQTKTNLTINQTNQPQKIK